MWKYFQVNESEQSGAPADPPATLSARESGYRKWIVGWVYFFKSTPTLLSMFFFFCPGLLLPSRLHTAHTECSISSAGKVPWVS